MSKRIYISADYSKEDGDLTVVETLNKWANDNFHITDFIDMSKVISGSVSDDLDCRACDLKNEFNHQINKSSIVVFVVGDKTAKRTSGSNCDGITLGKCTPYKQNTNGTKYCDAFKWSKYYNVSEDVCPVNNYSYLRHEFEEAVKKNKQIVIFYNSTRKETTWLPTYMSKYESLAIPFWTLDGDNKKPNYSEVKKALGYE